MELPRRHRPGRRADARAAARSRARRARSRSRSAARWRPRTRRASSTATSSPRTSSWSRATARPTSSRCWTSASRAAPGVRAGLTNPGRRDGDARVHGARAGGGRRRRPPQRHLFGRRAALRDGDRAAAAEARGRDDVAAVAAPAAARRSWTGSSCARWSRIRRSATRRWRSSSTTWSRRCGGGRARSSDLLGLRQPEARRDDAEAPSDTPPPSRRCRTRNRWGRRCSSGWTPGGRSRAVTPPPPIPAAAGRGRR